MDGGVPDDLDGHKRKRALGRVSWRMAQEAITYGHVFQTFVDSFILLRVATAGKPRVKILQTLLSELGIVPVEKKPLRYLCRFFKENISLADVAM